MDYLIAPTLFQNKTCRLPGIGTLEIVVKNAETFFGHQEILAPKPSIFFNPAVEEEEDLFNEFTALSKLIKKDLQEKGVVSLKGIGDFILTTEGAIEFKSIEISKEFMQPVIAERVVRQDVEHTILVGDKEVTNKAMTDFYVEEAKVAGKNRWWIAAVIVAFIALVAVVIYLTTYGINSFGKMF